MAKASGPRNRNHFGCNSKRRLEDEGKLPLNYLVDIFEKEDSGATFERDCKRRRFIKVVFVPLAFPLVRRFCFQLQTRGVVPVWVQHPGQNASSLPLKPKQ